MKKKKSSAKSAFFNLRVLFAFMLCSVGAVLALAAFGALEAAPPTQPSATPTVATGKVPFLTLKTAPDVPQCHGVLKQDIIDLVNSASEDPGVTFEKNRRAHPHMVA